MFSRHAALVIVMDLVGTGPCAIACEQVGGARASAAAWARCACLSWCTRLMLCNMQHVQHGARAAPLCGRGRGGCSGRGPPALLGLLAAGTPRLARVGRRSGARAQSRARARGVLERVREAVPN